MTLPIRTRSSFLPQSVFPPGSFHKPHSSPSEGRQNENHNYRKLIKLITWTTALSNSVKLLAMSCRATQDGQVIVESSDKTWSAGEENGKPLQYFCLENPTNSMKWIKPYHILNTISSKSLTWNFVVESFLSPESKKQQMIVVLNW